MTVHSPSPRHLPHSHTTHLISPSRLFGQGALLALALLGACAGSVAPDPESELGSTAQAVGGGEDPIVPPPGGLNATEIGPHSLKLWFQCGSGQAAWHTMVRIDPNGAMNEFWSVPSCAVGNWTSVVSGGLQPQTQYCYYVVAGNEFYSDVSDTVCPTTAPDLVAPTLPTVRITEIWQHGFRVNIADLSNNESYFKVYAQKAGETKRQILTTERDVRSHFPTGEVISREYSDPSYLPSDTQVEVFVEVGHTHAPVHAETAHSVIRTLRDAPATPTNLVITDITHKAVSVKWAAAARANEYVVSWNRPGYPAQQAIIYGGSLETTIEGLSSLTNYELAVAARNNGGTSGFSNTVFFKTGAIPIVDKAREIALSGPDAPYEGQLGFFGTALPEATGVVKALVVRSTAFRQAGLIFIRPGAPSTADCGDPTKSRRIAVNQRLTGADLDFIFPSRNLDSGLFIRACAGFDGVLPPPNWFPSVTMEYTVQVP